jgi:hypothetical protein
MQLLGIRASFCKQEQAADDSSPLSIASSVGRQYSTRSNAELEQTMSSLAKTPKTSAQYGAGALTPTAGSWMAAMQRKTQSGSVDVKAEDERITRKACAILNKLTVEKFDSLFEQLATCGICKPEHLEMLMREVFNKATTQHHFIPMYADLCVRLEQDSRISSVVEASGKQHSFRRLLLNQCQIAFEKLLEPDDAKEADVDEEYRLRRKQQALGNIKLIGQLLVHGIVISKLLVECAEELLRSYTTCAEALESLAAMLTVAGKQFDNSTWQYHPRLLEVFACMRKLSKDKTTQARVRFLLRDVLDVRDGGWSHCTYKATLNAAPMKLEEVRESAVNEGKYISRDEQIETDNLLAGLQRISQMAVKKQNDYTPKSTAHNADSTTPCTKSTPSSKASRHRSARTSFGMAKESQSDSAEDAAAVGEQEENPDSEGKTVFAEGAGTPQFNVVSFRRALATILGDLASDRNVPAAVRRIRLQEVPPEFQAKEFADIVTRIVEERRGPVRRCALAFTAGLAAAEQSAFDRMRCLDGIGLFFQEVYPELGKEIPRLPAIITSEFLPTLRNVFPKGELNKRLPNGLGFQDKGGN